MASVSAGTPGVYVKEVPSGVRLISGVETSVAAFMGDSPFGPLTPTKVSSWREFTNLYGTASVIAAVTRVVGSGVASSAPPVAGAGIDGAVLNLPWGVGFAPNGELWITQGSGQGMLTADLTAATITQVVPNGGGYGPAFRPDESALITEYGLHTVRSVRGDASGGSVVAGISGIACAGLTDPCGDSGLAIEATLNQPAGVSVFPDGSYLIADYSDHRVRMVDTAGTITTVAGTGTPGFSGDGGSAIDAQLDKPAGVLVRPDGGFYIAEDGNRRVRWVDPEGIIHTVAGNGIAASVGDGGPPEDASLNFPKGLLVGPDGALYISDADAHNIRVVARGTISTLRLYEADTGAPVSLDEPEGLAWGPDGALYFSDALNHSVWKADLSTRVSGLAQGVYAHFANGGGPCWISRIPAASPRGAGLTTDEILACYQGTSQVPGYAGTGLAGLKRVAEVTIVAAPGLWDTPGVDEAGAKTVQQEMAGHCAVMGNRMAILDPPRDKTPDEVKEWATSLGLDDTAKRYAAVYYPWITAPALQGGGDVSVPPSGHLAGVWCRSDARRGVHKAPANEALANTTDLAYRLTDGEQSELNPVGVNCLRYFPEQGFLVWGARTLSGETDWQYINVRRLINYLEESIKLGTNWAVFEPNDERLWSGIKRNVTAFLTDMFRSGALQGATAEEAFYVVCDATNNPPEELAQGRVLCEVGIAAVRPAEFIIFEVMQIIGTPAQT
ncbi:phage tail sheath subtilisin-like domain-containing protein [Streptomyces sp. NPDC092307]|uniref:NHL domain-containing protein n=1 Tax=Streptomyces sp. NPDC092307 TaxID=3366013 RepID=UPI0038166BF9